MRAHIFLALALLQASAGVASARQHDRSADSETCPAGTISVIFVDNHSIFDTTDPNLDPRFGWAYRVANALHFRTREEVIRRELLVRPGDCFAPLLLEESARLLRAYDFLSRADVYGVLHDDGTYHVIVDTQDEWSTRVDLRVDLADGPNFEGLRLSESNLLGTGRSVEAFFFEDDTNREYGAGYATRQLAGTRWDLSVTAGRTRAGSFAAQSLAYPFVGETGTWAARQSFRSKDRFFDFTVDEADAPKRLLVPVHDLGFDAAVVRRIGSPGSLWYFGGALSYSELRYPGGANAIEAVGGEDGQTIADPVLASRLDGQLQPLRTLRFLALVGQRRIQWIKRQGLDALKGDQDIRLGSEAEIAFGRSLPLPNHDDALVTTVQLYNATEMGPLLLASTIRADGRREFGGTPHNPGWADLYADVRALAYWKPDDSRHTLVAQARAEGGWATRTPFQLTLGGDLGVRGYPNDRFPGGQRIVLSLEDRIYFGWPFREVLDLGGTAFVDIGRIWPGDVPFGTDSGWRASAGVGLRGAFPAGGRMTYRVDLAMPLTHGAGWKDLRLILSVGEILGLKAQGRRTAPGDVRQIEMAGGVFHFPD